MRALAPFCCLALPLLAAVATPAAAGQRPNVLVILADDLGYGDLGCYGHPKFKTPNLDGMARRGARLDHFTTPVPFCAPTRGSLRTGRYPLRNGLTSNPCPKEDPASNGQADGVALPRGEVTLAQVLRAAGYRTGIIGKWHLGHYRESLPLQRGFDEYFGIPYSNDMHRVVLLEGNREAEYPVVQATLTRRYTERALQFLEANKDRPFFLYLAHAMPHKPLACSEEFYGKSGAGLYGDVIMELDWGVGQVLARLRELGLEDNTLVIFTSDNGPWYGGSTGGLRGMKGRNWEGGVRVPFLACWPGRIPANHRSDAPATTPDVFATALAAAGVAPPKDRVLDGRDLLPLLTGKAKESPHRAVFTSKGDRLCGVRMGPWKLYLASPGPVNEKVLAPTDPWVDPRRPDGVRLLAPYEQAHPSQYPGVYGGDPVPQVGLFHLTDDPAERRNVADRHPEVVRQMRRLAEEFEASLAAEKKGG